jgi:hypothetical protein
MKKPVFLFFAFVLLALAPTARAGQAEVREVARINNCAPKKIEVYQQSLGLQGAVIYHVDCNMPKATGETGGPDALLINCNGSLCELLRPVAAEKK